MAMLILMKHPNTGIMKKGYIGFSWTTFFFSAFPALFRGDFLTFLGFFAITAIISCFTFGIGGLIAATLWAFFYNNWYTKRLMERGYMFADESAATDYARFKLGVVRVIA